MRVFGTKAHIIGDGGVRSTNDRLVVYMARISTMDMKAKSMKHSTHGFVGGSINVCIPWNMCAWS